MMVKHFIEQIKALSKKTDLTRNEKIELIEIGVLLFHSKAYWEAHEAWEVVWQRENKKSERGLLLQGMIQAAAAMLKHQQGVERGFKNLSHRAMEKLNKVKMSEIEGVNVTHIYDTLLSAMQCF